ncbi:MULTISPECIES: SDR family oxidoreductase [unclassified Halomonas]|uniref:SDR family oxidoreductase n=1 Tax=unclassified Halomonas TaxID=2609666 RepID=UPI0020766CF6|nr:MULTISPECIES: SDR family oxidoreductase [unclassified Halomonas]
MPTILITGCSSGFGLATARHFAARGWRVVATMRTPDESILPSSVNLRTLALDVTDPASIARAVAAAGPIDALVNNAGIGLLSTVEGTSMAVARELFETNTLGTIAMTQAVLPQMRERGAGTIVNVTSSVTLMPLPLLALYTASKAAVNALSDSMAIELEPFGIRVRTVLPGRAPDTAFAANAGPRMAGGIPEAYGPLAERVFAAWQEETGALTSAEDVAQAIWRSVTDAGSPARLAAGADAVALMQAV